MESAHMSIHNENSDKLKIDAERQRRKQKGSMILSYCVKGKGKPPPITPSISHRWPCPVGLGRKQIQPAKRNQK